MKNKKNIAILASGNGSNFEAIVNKIKDGTLTVGKCILVTDKKNALARKRAQKLQIKDIFIDPSQYKNRQAYDQKLIEVLKKENIDAVILAGYMRILSPLFLRHFKNKILNIHPSLLPHFPGKNAIKNAFSQGAQKTGVTVHFVNEIVDGGPIIAQESIPIEKNMSLEELKAKIHEKEHWLYPYVLKFFLEDKLKIEDNHVKIT